MCFFLFLFYILCLFFHSGCRVTLDHHCQWQRPRLRGSRRIASQAPVFSCLGSHPHNFHHHDDASTRDHHFQGQCATNGVLEMRLHLELKYVLLYFSLFLFKSSQCVHCAAGWRKYMIMWPSRFMFLRLWCVLQGLCSMKRCDRDSCIG